MMRLKLLFGLQLLLTLVSCLNISELYPFGPSAGDTVFPYGDDQSSLNLQLPNFPYYGNTYQNVAVNSNGRLSFFGRDNFFPLNNQNFPFPGRPFIAVFWGDTFTDNRIPDGNQISYRILSTGDSALTKVTKTIRDTFENTFTPTRGLIATWYKVGSFQFKSTPNTFQVVICTDGTMSYAVFNYPSGGIQWYDNNVLVGFNKGDLDGTALPLPNSKSNYVNLLEFQSNIAKPGQWAFRIDPDIIQLDNCSPNPCGHGTCQSTGAGFTCECDDNWFGDKCDVSPCVALDCMNSGVCTATSPTSATCACPSGISGNRCQISPCSSNPCPAGISCVVTSPGPSYMCDSRLFAYGRDFGDSVLEKVDDASFGPYDLPFVYYGSNHTQIYINNNGLLSFDNVDARFTFDMFPLSGVPRIAGYWGDVDTRGNILFGNNVFYQVLKSGDTALNQLRDTVRTVYPIKLKTFEPIRGFITTWQDVGRYKMQTVPNTFQVVIGTNGDHSFAVLNYRANGIRWLSGQAGFDSGDGVHFFNVPYSGTPQAVQIPDNSNIGVKGRYVFRIDENTIYGVGCNPNPCQNGGSCKETTDNDDGYICTCKTGFSGQQCENNACDPNPCQNGGTCKKTANGAACTCPTGFSGANCEIDSCDPSPCLNGGTCDHAKNANGYTCSCSDGFSGGICQVTPCSNNPCQNGGTCTISGSSYQCACKEGWTGKNCQNDPCSSNPCQNGGTCSVNSNQSGGFQCSCKAGFIGTNCQVDVCDSNPCSNGGVCSHSNNENGFTCSCTNGFGGPICQVSYCGSRPCLNGGTCIGLPNGFECQCPASYSGRFCQNDVCQSQPCLNGGNCTITNDDSGYTCSCQNGFQGPRCQVNTCSPNPCQNGGTCSPAPNENGYVCTCSLGFTGPTCQQQSCSPNPCQNGGVCNAANNDHGYKCTCPVRWIGINCQTLDQILASNPCGYWRFDTDAKLRDSSPNGNNLNSFTTNVVEYPLPFDGANGALTFFAPDVLSARLSGVSITDSFTVEALLSNTVPASSPILMLTQTGLSDSRSLNFHFLENGALEATFDGAKRIITPPRTLPQNQLTHIAFTKAKNILTIYVNGEPIQTARFPAPFRFQNGYAFLGYDFYGILDHVALFCRPLSDAEVKAHYDFINIDGKKTTCNANLCQNGGFCGPSPLGTQCFCPPCWTGSTCEEPLLGCQYPCENGATYSGGVCHCAAGFTGSTCANHVQCTQVVEQGARYATSDSYASVTGTCLNGGFGGPYRRCLHDGTWSPIVGRCLYNCPKTNFAGAQWPESRGGNLIHGKCTGGKTGDPITLCNSDGTWGKLIRGTPCQ